MCYFCSVIAVVFNITAQTTSYFDVEAKRLGKRYRSFADDYDTFLEDFFLTTILSGKSALNIWHFNRKVLPLPEKQYNYVYGDIILR